MKQTDLCMMFPDMLPRLWSFAFRLSRNGTHAEEVVERACIRGLGIASQLAPGSSALNWMFSIIYSIWLSDRKECARSNDVEADSSNVSSDVMHSPPRADGGDELTSQVSCVVERLPESQRVALLLVSAEELDYEEAAGVLDVPVSTVIARLSAARITIGGLVTAYNSTRS